MKIDIIPIFRFIGAIILFGLSYYFLDTTVTMMWMQVPVYHTYFSALLFLWTILPAIVLFSSGIRTIMISQKRRMI